MEMIFSVTFEHGISSSLAGTCDISVVVIRYEGPKGGPGMREMLSPTAAIIGAGLDTECALEST